jgi:hypothetical protein
MYFQSRSVFFFAKGRENRVYSNKASVVEVGSTYIKRVLPLFDRKSMKVAGWIEEVLYFYKPTYKMLL